MQYIEFFLIQIVNIISSRKWVASEKDCICMHNFVVLK